MLGEILGGLTDPLRAEAVLTLVGRPEMRERILGVAAEDGVAAGELVASRVRHLVEHGDEEIWLDLVGAMAASPHPAAAAVERVLARAFPDPVRVRFTRRAS
ncbi:hypothetical protein SAMN02745194_03705 [Roseomonas rosea]|uniref:Uncharacterized protein n=1 Tax=Muricoccus roseus TaxID=198092 RepID=A0A1M6N4F5_9PROT|nr:hypothetical protein [Roseomonas rosea]SHJ90570.1 hypothetical protein SAMN02745194_03705 [Roseomonas rosea]